MIEVYFLREDKIYRGSILREERGGVFWVDCRELGERIPLDRNYIFNTIEELLGSIKMEYLSRTGIV